MIVRQQLAAQSQRLLTERKRPLVVAERAQVHAKKVRQACRLIVHALQGSPRNVVQVHDNGSQRDAGDRISFFLKQLNQAALNRHLCRGHHLCPRNPFDKRGHNGMNRYGVAIARQQSEVDRASDRVGPGDLPAMLRPAGSLSYGLPEQLNRHSHSGNELGHGVHQRARCPIHTIRFTQPAPADGKGRFHAQIVQRG